MDIYNKPLPILFLYHHGIKGQKWGVRNGPPYPLSERKQKKVNELKKTYQSKIQTGKTHYEKSIRDVNKAKNETDKQQRKYYKWSGATQYGKGKSYEKKAARIRRKLKRYGVDLSESQSFIKLREEAGRYYIKKALPRRVLEKSADSVSRSAQLAGQLFIRKMLPMPISMLVSHKPIVIRGGGIPDYKMKDDILLYHYCKTNLNEFLAHHGILGQKWGVRNGPPYPLGSSDHSASEKKAGWQKSVHKKNGVGNSMQAQLYSAQKNSVNEHQNDSSSPKRLNISPVAKQAAKKYSLPLKNGGSTIADDIRKANPDWEKKNSDPVWMMNCTHSVFTFAARMQGLDVVAKPIRESSIKNGGLRYSEVSQFVKGGLTDGDRHFMLCYHNPFKKAEKYEKDATKLIEHSFGSMPDGSYGAIVYQGALGGHVFVWYKENGQIKFADPQMGTNNASIAFQNIELLCKKCNGAYISTFRLDNRELELDRITEYATARR